VPAGTPTLAANDLRRRLEDTERTAREAIEQQPDDAAAWLRLGEALGDLWRLREAEAALLKATALSPDNAAALSALAGVQANRGRYDEALAATKRASRLRSDLAEPHRHRASVLLAFGKLEEAARAAADARRLDPDSIDSVIVLATTWFYGGLRDGARRLLNRGIAAHPDSAEALVTRASMECASKEIEAAETDLAAALSLKPWLPPALALRSQMHREQGRVLEALDAIDAARRHHPDSEDYLLAHLDLLDQAGRQKDALALAMERLTVHQKSRRLRMRLAMLLLQEGRLDQALRHIPGVLPTATAASAWEVLGATWAALGRERERRTCLERAVALDPSASATLALAHSQFRLGETEAALARVEPLTPTLQTLLIKAEMLTALSKFDEAAAALESAIALKPDDALSHMRLGIAHRRRKAFEQAEVALRRAAGLAPAESVTHEQLAILLSEVGRYDEALEELRRGLELAPGSRSLRFNVAVLMARQKRWPEAERGLRDMVSVAPFNLNAIGNLGRVLAEQQRYEEAADVFEHAVELTPLDIGARHGLLGALRDMRRHDEAVKASRHWLEDAPTEPHAWRSLALSLGVQGEAEALEAAAKVAELAPDTAMAFETWGLVCLNLGRAQDAIEWFDKGLAVSPNQPSLLVNRALALDDVVGLEAAAGELEKALEIEKDSENSKLNLSMVRLRLGQFEGGWPLYESRASAMRGPKTLTEAKKKTGARPDLSNASVFVRAEQGLGDTIHFMRYVPMLAAEARDVTFQLQDQIAWMAWGMAPNVRVCGYRDPIPSYSDYQVSLISLPGYYDTNLDTIPGKVPYVTPESDRVAEWRTRLGTNGFKVGLVWHTNPAHGNIKRWIPLKHLVPLAGIPGVRLISLQKYHGLDQLAAVQDTVKIETLGDKFDEGPDAFADAAAVVANLDLVITIDTSMGHLAGALAKPCWVLLPRSSDWRWLTKRRDTPWYPTLRLFQQRKSGHWDDVAADLHETLSERAQQPNDSTNP